jgi:ketosteroid isomerase-like protein
LPTAREQAEVAEARAAEFVEKHVLRMESVSFPHPRDTAAEMAAQQNVAIIRETWDAWERGDIAGVVAVADPEVTMDINHFHDWPESSYRGRDGVRRFLTEWLEIWDSFEVRLDELRVCHDKRVLALAWQRGIGHVSGLAMEMEWALIYTLRDGAIIEMQLWGDRGEATAAAGLEK